MNKSRQLTESEHRQLDEVCDEFEDRFHSDQPVPIEKLLDRNSQVLSRHDLLERLIPLEIELGNHGFTQAVYRQLNQRFPEDRFIIDRVFENSKLTDADEDLQRTLKSSGENQDPRLHLTRGEVVAKYEIVRFIGAGAFGAVYQAVDLELDREVALKVTSNQSESSSARFVAEAKNSANIKAAGIATIYDLIVDEDRVFIVQEYIPGTDLKKLLASRKFSIRESVQLIIAAAQAISHAHERGVFHRDLKPSNIVVGRDGMPTVIDFGLAYQGKDRSRLKPSFCGTPSYMSPEQVRGESNRTDASTDIWALGVILYEMLCGQLPFRGDNRTELFNEIEVLTPETPSKIQPRIPADLDRIILKCLSKLQINRYREAKHLANDLLATLNQDSTDQAVAPTGRKIQPRGLRSFGFDDGYFFLDLLPGPKNRNGIPESLEFWKQHIEDFAVSPELTVGLIYGPSGCGKTSFVKAGLIPLLSPEIKPIYIECTRDDTDIRVLRSLANEFPDLDSDLSLPELFAHIRDEEILPEDEKLVVFLDQFEQWLSANPTSIKTQLLSALRHCDGRRIQAVVLIREDFWSQANQVMQQLEIPLRQLENCQQLEPFDVDHAGRVLAEIGKAYDRFEDGVLTAEGNEFVNVVIEELSAHGRITGAQLAFFAEACKDKEWTVQQLREMGGPLGAGVFFLNERFVSERAPKEYRAHFSAAQKLLSALLPQGNSKLKGHMLSHEQLQIAAGYHHDPGRFAELLNILDNDLRLISATDAVVGKGIEPAPAKNKLDNAEFYQLSHDYLVPVLGNWIDIERQRHITGRIRKRMSEVASIWSESSDARYLPTWLETLSFAVFSKWKLWTPVQKEMMRASAAKYAVRTILLLFALIPMVIAGWSINRHFESERLSRNIRDMQLNAVPEFVQQKADYRSTLVPALHQEFGELIDEVREEGRDVTTERRAKLNIAVALAMLDDSHWDAVAEGLFAVSEGELSWLTELLQPKRKQIRDQLKEQLVSNPLDRGFRAKRAAITLALWNQPEFLAEMALDFDASELRPAIELLKGNTDATLERLNRVQVDLMNLIDLEPEESLVELFDQHGGVIDRSGGIIFCLPEKDQNRVFEAAFQSGYLPVSVRPYERQGELVLACCWQQNRDYAFKNLGDCLIIEKAASEEKIQTLLEQNPEFRIQDISCYRWQNENRFAAVLVLENEPTVEAIVALDLESVEFDERAAKMGEQGFQISRMFTRSGPQGKPLFTAIWDRESDGKLEGPRAVLNPEIDLLGRLTRRGPRPGIGYADCQLEKLDLMQRELFSIHQHLHFYQSRVANLVSSSDTIPRSRTSDIKNYARLSERLGKLSVAKNLYGRLNESDPSWLDRGKYAASLYSILNNQEQLEDELLRLKETGVTTGEVTFPMMRLRFSVHNQLVDEAEKQYEILLDRLAAIRQSATTTVDLERMNRHEIRGSLILAEAYTENSVRRQQLVAHALTLLKELGPEKYDYLLVDQDFDLIRQHKEFRQLIARHDLWLRVATSYRIDPEVESSLKISINSFDEGKEISRNWFNSGYRPRCLSTRWMDNPTKWFADLILEKSLNDTGEISDGQLKKLANLAFVKMKLGDHQMFNMMLEERFGDRLRSLIAKKISQ